MVLEKPRDLCTTPRPLQSWRARSWKPTWEVEHRRQNHHATNCSDSCCFLSLNFISFHAGVSWFWSVSSGQFVLTPVMCFVPWQSRVLSIIGILALLKGSNVFPFSTRDSSLSISWWHLSSVISFFCSFRCCPWVRLPQGDQNPAVMNSQFWQLSVNLKPPHIQRILEYQTDWFWQQKSLW